MLSIFLPHRVGLMKYRRIMAGTVAGGLAAAGLFTLTQTGGSDVSTKSWYFAKVTGSASWDTRADVEFNDYGEWFYVEDHVRDGWGAEAQYRLDSLSSRTYILDNNQGAGTERAFDRSFAEGRTVYFRACIQQGDTKRCGYWTKATA